MAKRTKKMTKEQALKQLAETRELSTSMLEPLGIPFEWFLRYAQLDDDAAQTVVERLIAYLSK